MYNVRHYGHDYRYKHGYKNNTRDWRQNNILYDRGVIHTHTHTHTHNISDD